MRRAALLQARRAALLCNANAATPSCGIMLSPGLEHIDSSLAAQWQQQRGLQLFEIFSKENRAKRKKRLQEDLERGYFDDFKELKDTGGKLWRSPDRLTPAEAAQPFPPIKVVRPDKVATTFPHAPDRAPAAQLVCVGFKDGAEDMLATWSDPFVEAFRDRGAAGLVELSVVESQVMALWPFRNMILAAPRRTAAAAAAAVHSAGSPVSPTEQAVASTAGGGDGTAGAAATGGPAPPSQGTGSEASSSGGGGGTASSSAAGAVTGTADVGSSTTSGGGASGSGGGSGSGAGGGDQPVVGGPVTTGEPPVLTGKPRVGRLHTEYLFYFGDAYDVCRALQISNRLTGYVFLLDREGRVRFRGCGKAEAGERDTLTAAARQLLEAG